MSKKRELLKNTIIIFLGKFSTQFLTFFLLPIYTKSLDSSAYGKIDLILTYLALFVPIITIQYEMGVFRFIIDSRSDTDKQNVIIKNSFHFYKVISLFIILISLIILLFIKNNLIYLVSICALSIMFSNLLMQIARGKGENTKYSVSCFVTGVTNIIFNIIFILVLKIGENGILLSTCLSNIICCLYLFISLNISSSLKEKYNREIHKDILKYSWPLVPNTISWWLINASDRTIVSLIISVAANGVYAISTKFSAIINSFLNIFNLSWTESASLHINDPDRDDFFSTINDSILRLMSSLCILLISFMPILFTIFIDESYSEAYKYIPINILASFFSCMVSIYSSIYIAKKMTKQVASTSFWAAFINIIVDLVLMKYIGIYAASISTCVAYLIMTIYRSIDLKKYINIKYDIKLLVVICLMFIVAFYLYYQNNNITNIFNYILSLSFFIYMNYDYIVSIYKKIKSKVIK